MAVEYDEIGIWSEVTLAIVKEYASLYDNHGIPESREDIAPTLDPDIISRKQLATWLKEVR